jgi:hypothetical protein
LLCRGFEVLCGCTALLCAAAALHHNVDMIHNIVYQIIYRLYKTKNDTTHVSHQ